MAAGNWILYNKAHFKLVNGTLDLDTNLFRMRIFKAQAAGSVSSSALSLLSEIGTENQAGNMSDYPLTGASVVALNGSATYKWSIPALVITASGGDATSLQYAVVYNSLSAGGGHVLMWNKLSTAAFDVTSGNTLTVTSTNGGFVIY